MSYTNSSSHNGRGTTLSPESNSLESKSQSPAEVPLLEEPESRKDLTRHKEPVSDTPASPIESETLDEPTPKEPRKRPVKLILAVVLGVGAIAAAATFGYRWFQYASTHQETDNATVTGHVHQISSRIPGTVIAVPVDDNELVKQGQLLARLDPKDYQIKVQQALAALQVAQRQALAAQSSISLASANTQAQTTQAQGSITGAIASISDAQAAVAETQAGVPVAQSQVAQAEATLQEAQANFRRYSELFESGAVSRQQLDSAQATYNVAIARRNAAQQGVNQAQAQLNSAQEGVAKAQAQLQTTRGGLQEAQAGAVQTEVNRSQYEAANAAIAQAMANLQAAQLQLSYINITAPEAGRIGRRTVEVGQQVTAGQPLMAVVGNDMWIVANFKETQVQQMHPGELVEVKLDAFPGRRFTGRVNSLSPASGAEFALLPPDNATGNFTKVVQRIPVKIAFDPQSIQGLESQITPGMSADVSVEMK